MLAALLLMLAPAVDHGVVVKSQHTLTLYAHGTAFKTYYVALDRVAGVKEFQGDYKTPEGHYFITGHNPHSTAYLSLHISYPNADDRARAARLHKPAGGDIMIHGLPNGTPALALHERMDLRLCGAFGRGDEGGVGSGAEWDTDRLCALNRSRLMVAQVRSSRHRLAVARW